MPAACWRSTSFSFHLQVGQRSLLFDTGQSDLFLPNALKLHLSLAGAEAIVLSHGHNDHTGGLKAAHEAAPQARLFLHVPPCHRSSSEIPTVPPVRSGWIRQVLRPSPRQPQA